MAEKDFPDLWEHPNAYSREAAKAWSHHFKREVQVTITFDVAADRRMTRVDWRSLEWQIERFVEHVAEDGTPLVMPAVIAVEHHRDTIRWRPYRLRPEEPWVDEESETE